jgi:hypothetical protein
MGSDDLFKKRREDRKQRKYEYKKPKANSFLIVTEGKCTEPYYFQGIKRLISEKIGGRIDVVEVPMLDIRGGGCATRKLIEVTRQLVKRANIIYQNIWVVFDKDDFTDFDKAIQEGIEEGYQIAWSNPSFEYWLYLHFYYSDAALHRDEWNKKLDELFREYQLGSLSYQKNYEMLYQMLDSFGGVTAAIKNARRRMAAFDTDACSPSLYAPGTMVHQLVEELKKYLDE